MGLRRKGLKAVGTDAGVLASRALRARSLPRDDWDPRDVGRDTVRLEMRLDGRDEGGLGRSPVDDGRLSSGTATSSTGEACESGNDTASSSQGVGMGREVFVRKRMRFAYGGSVAST